MRYTTTATRGLVVAPHHLAAETGVAILREGGNAIEAMVAAAATIPVVYPHMNSIGGDGFWLIRIPGRPPVAIEACGPAGGAVDVGLYRDRGLTAVPPRGPLAANTVAGTVSGWGEALALAGEIGGTMARERLFEDAIDYAEHGVPVTEGQSRLTSEKLEELRVVPGFAGTYLEAGAAPPPGARFRQPRLARTLGEIAARGPDDFYRGDLGRRVAADLTAAGSPITGADLAAYRARRVAPLSLRLAAGTVYNLPPPTQGLASLMILGVFERLGIGRADGFDFVHGLVEATKQAFLVRDDRITDPAYLDGDPRDHLTAGALAEAAGRIDPARALEWPRAGGGGDTVWMGAIDAAGVGVSFIQSLYWEFGSGVVLEETGITWQNRGASFRLEEGALQRIRPGRLPFHTLNPALAELADGRIMVYGTMGGEGQPQTQAALFTRYTGFGQGLQAAVTAPRWLLGRTWGAESTTLKLESRFPVEVVRALGDAGHPIELVEPFSDLMGHAGAVVRAIDGVLEGASDPRSDGRAAGY